MIFINTLFLYLLPLALVPLLIHLLNLLRYRKVAWAATRFIFNIDRHSTRRIKLLQWLLLAARILLLAFLVLALARPLFRGLLERWSWGAPKNTLIVFDRSASMNNAAGPQGKTAHDLAIQAVKEICSSPAGRFYVIDTVGAKIMEVPEPKALNKSAALSPTDMGADFPRLFAEVARFLSQENLGDVDIHVLSDMRQADWRPESPQWAGATAVLRSKSQEIRLRLLDCSGTAAATRVLEIARMALVERDKERVLAFTLKLDNQGVAPSGNVDLPYVLNGVPGAAEPLTPRSTGVEYFKRELKLPQGQPLAWGCWRIGDGGGCGGASYFGAGVSGKMRVALLAESADRRAGLVADVLSGGGVDEAEVVRIDPSGSVDLEGFSVIVAAGRMPNGLEARIDESVGRGAQAIMFPPADAPCDEVAGPVDLTGVNVAVWDRQAGILADALDGSPMPAEQVVCRKIMKDAPSDEAYASLADGKVWLTRRNLGAGTLYRCRSALDSAWSNLCGTPLFVIMLQRLVEESFAKTGPVRHFDCGALRGENLPSDVEPLCVNGEGAGLMRAGVYKIGVNTVVLNTPRSELAAAKMDKAGFDTIFKGVPYSATGVGEGMAGGREAWPLLVLAAMAMCLLESLVGVSLAGGGSLRK